MAKKAVSKDIGVALSGSGFLFPAHCGSLRALEDLGYHIKEIAGTSGGGLISILYASGMNLVDMGNLIMTEDWSQYMKLRWFNWWNGLCDPQPMLTFLEKVTNNKTFKDTSIPLTVVSSNLVNGNPFVFSTEGTPNAPLSIGGRATSSIPFIYPPVVYQDALLVDGGVTNNIPVDQLSPNIRRIGIELVGTQTVLQETGWIDMSEQIIDMMISSNEMSRVSWAKATGAHIIEVDRGGYGFLDGNLTADQRTNLYDNGYNTVKKALS